MRLGLCHVIDLGRSLRCILISMVTNIVIYKIVIIMIVIMIVIVGMKMKGLGSEENLPMSANYVQLVMMISSLTVVGICLIILIAFLYLSGSLCISAVIYTG